MGSLNLNGIDFDIESAASLTEAAFIEQMSEIASLTWPESEDDRIERLKIAHKLITTQHDNGGTDVPKIPEPGPDGDNGGGGDGKAGSDTGSEQKPTGKRNGQKGSAAE